MGHIPVLLAEVLAYLQPEPGKLYVDATLGGGGHTRAMLERVGPSGTVLGIDQDPVILAQTRGQLAADNLLTWHGNYSAIADALAAHGLDRITGGVLADLGVSSFQLDQAERGFSFSKAAPLDMRMDTTQAKTAADVVNTYAEAELTRLFSVYGEEHLSKTIAREIVRQRRQQPFHQTTELAGLITQCYARTGKLRGSQKSRIHPATRVFQALRIETNDELAHLERFLQALPPLLASGARAVVISFHSLEDRIVKDFFRRESKDCLCPPGLPVCRCHHQPTLKVITGKPVTATEAEVRDNPRSRSAKLRCAERR